MSGTIAMDMAKTMTGSERVVLNKIMEHEHDLLIVLREFTKLLGRAARDCHIEYVLQRTEGLTH